MSESQNPTESTKDIIIKTINAHNPQTTRHLVDIIQKTTTLSKKEIIKGLHQLQLEGRINFNTKIGKSTSFGTYLFSFESAWYWTIIAIALATILAVFTIPQYGYPMAYIRNLLGLIFVLFLPGYAFIKAVFQKKVPIKTSSESFDNIERLILSIAMSIALTPMIGLLLYYTPIGIGIAPVTLSLLTLTVLLATAAISRQHSAKSSTL